MDNTHDGAPFVGVAFNYDKEDDLVKPYLDASEPELEPTPLSRDEKILLKECETEIDDNLQGFTLVGARLYTIWSQKLYRETHRSFEAYCKAKWGFSRFHASRLIKANQVVAHLIKPHQPGNISLPPTEAAARTITLYAEWEQNCLIPATQQRQAA